MVVYWYTHGLSDYTGQMYLSTQTLPYHTVVVDCATLTGRADTPDGYMGGQSIAGVWLIREQRWITELTHPSLQMYSWDGYPPLQHGAITEPSSWPPMLTGGLARPPTRRLPATMRVLPRTALLLLVTRPPMAKTHTCATPWTCPLPSME